MAGKDGTVSTLTGQVLKGIWGLIKSRDQVRLQRDGYRARGAIWGLLICALRSFFSETGTCSRSVVIMVYVERSCDRQSN